MTRYVWLFIMKKGLYDSMQTTIDLQTTPNEMEEISYCGNMNCCEGDHKVSSKLDEGFISEIMRLTICSSVKGFCCSNVGNSVFLSSLASTCA